MNRLNEGVTVIATVIVAMSVPGCVTFQPQPGDPADLLAANGYDQVRAVLFDGSEYDIADPSVAGDSIVGRSFRRDQVVRVGEITLDTLTYSRIAVPLSGVSRVELPRFSAARTLLLVGGAAGAIYGMTAALAAYECC